MTHQFFDNNANDLLTLAQILGQESLSKSAVQTKRSGQQLADETERLTSR
jgi:hypothetical protein